MSKPIRLQTGGKRLRATSLLGASRKVGKGRFRKTKSNTLKLRKARSE